MSIVRAIRLGNTLSSGATDGAALEALMADASRRGEFSDLMNLRGQARRLADNAIPAAAICTSATALPLLMDSRTGADEFANSVMASSILLNSRPAMRAATMSPNGFRRWLTQFPYVRRTVFAATSDLVQGVTHANGLHVAVGGSGSTGTIATSTDGINWTARTNPLSSPVSFSDVAYAFGLFIAIDTSGRIITSPDGTTWTQRTNPASPPAGSSLTTMPLVQGEGRIAFGCRNSSNLPCVTHSTDGINWTHVVTYNAEATSAMHSLAYTGVYWITSFAYTSSGNVTLRYAPTLSGSPTWNTSNLISGTYSATTLHFLNNKLYVTNSSGNSPVQADANLNGAVNLYSNWGMSYLYGAVSHQGLLLFMNSSSTWVSADNGLTARNAGIETGFYSYALSGKLRVLNNVLFIVSGNSNQIGCNY